MLPLPPGAYSLLAIGSYLVKCTYFVLKVYLGAQKLQNVYPKGAVTGYIYIVAKISS